MRHVFTMPSSPPRWMDNASCLRYDPEWWFPGRGDRGGRARAICKKCPVRGECLEYALKGQVALGIWGGLSEDERRLRFKNSPLTAEVPAGLG